MARLCDINFVGYYSHCTLGCVCPQLILIHIVTMTDSILGNTYSVLCEPKLLYYIYNIIIMIIYIIIIIII